MHALRAGDMDDLFKDGRVTSHETSIHSVRVRPIVDSPLPARALHAYRPCITSRRHRAPRVRPRVVMFARHDAHERDFSRACRDFDTFEDARAFLRVALDERSRAHSTATTTTRAREDARARDVPGSILALMREACGRRDARARRWRARHS